MEEYTVERGYMRARAMAHGTLGLLALAVTLAVLTGSASANEILCSSGWQPVSAGSVSCGDYAFVSIASHPETVGGVDITVSDLTLFNNADSLRDQPYFCQADGWTEQPHVGNLTFLQNAGMGFTAGQISGWQQGNPDFDNGMVFFNANISFVLLRCATFDPAPPPTGGGDQPGAD